MDFYYNRKGFDKKTKLLTYLVNTTNYLLVITGPRKAGKTTFIEQWLSNKHELQNNNLDNILISKITLDYANKIDLDTIKEQCVTNWQLNINENFIINFKDVIANIPQDTMHQYLLVIDNAERLSKNVLQELVKLNSETDSLKFRLVLIGNNVLSDHVKIITRSKNYKIYNHKISPLSFKETRLFLIDFYKKHNRTVPFSFKQAMEIHKKSSGIILNIIREIRAYHAPGNKVIQKTKFKLDFFKELKNIKNKFSGNFINEYREVLRNISIASLGMVIIGLFIFQEEINENLNNDVDASQINLQVATNEVQNIESEIEQNKIKSVEEDNIESIKDEPLIAKPVAENNKEKVVPKTVVKKTVKSKKLKKVRKFKNTKDTPFVLSLDNDNYTIQLGAYLEKADAINFINKNIKNNNLKKDFKIVGAKRNNSIYYLVLYGNFATNKLATNYVKIMKQSLKDNGAWIRKIASIKSDIKNIG